MKNTYEKDLDSMKHLIASSNGSFDDYVSNLTPTERREFLDDMDYILGRTKSKYKKVLYVNMILFLVIGLSFINLQNNFSPTSAIIFISSFGFFPTSCYQLYKNWKTVRNYKIIKKAIQTSLFDDYFFEDDDSEFLLKGTKVRFIQNKKESF